MIDKKSARRYDDCLKYCIVAGKKALAQAGLDKNSDASAYSQLDLTRCGVLVGSGMGGLSVFQDGKQVTGGGEGGGRGGEGGGGRAGRGVRGAWEGWGGWREWKGHGEG